MPEQKLISLDQVGELLTILYLRLNGYFTTGFLLHGDKNAGVEGELDAVAIRFPHHVELTTRANDDGLLGLPTDYLDLIIAEVKTTSEPPYFNDSLIDCLRLQRTLSWAGVFEKEEAKTLGEAFYTEIKEYEHNQDGPPCVLWPDKSPHTRIRGVLFAPRRSNRRDGEHWYIHGQQMFKFIFDRLSGGEPHRDSAMNYDFGQWGLGLRNMVDYFKTVRRKDLTFNDLLKYMEEEFRYGK